MDETKNWSTYSKITLSILTKGIKDEFDKFRINLKTNSL